MVSAQKVAVIGFHDQRARVHLGRGHAASGGDFVSAVVSLVVGGVQTNLTGDTRWLPSRARAGAARARRYTNPWDAGVPRERTTSLMWAERRHGPRHDTACRETFDTRSPCLGRLSWCPAARTH